MSDTAIEDATTTDTPMPTLSLDGDAPRLAAAPAAAPPPEERSTPMVDPEGTIDIAAGAPSLPTAAPAVPVLTSPDVSHVPSGQHEGEPVAAAPTTGEPRHPMAHLMPETTGMSESQLRAAAIRAEQKAKSRKIKIGLAVGTLAVTAIVGPPLFSWLTDAINEAGNVQTEVEE